MYYNVANNLQSCEPDPISPQGASVSIGDYKRPLLSYSICLRNN